jgi:hypothetical protein
VGIVAASVAHWHMQPTDANVAETQAVAHRIVVDNVEVVVRYIVVVVCHVEVVVHYIVAVVCHVEVVVRYIVVVVCHVEAVVCRIEAMANHVEMIAAVVAHHVEMIAVAADTDAADSAHSADWRHAPWTVAAAARRHQNQTESP